MRVSRYQCKKILMFGLILSIHTMMYGQEGQTIHYFMGLNFYILFSIGLISIIFFIYKWRMNVLQKKHSLLLSQITLANQKLGDNKQFIEQQALEIRSLDLSKSNFITNVSQELKDPISQIMTPLNTVMNSENLSDKNRNLLSKAQTSAKSLMKIVGSITDFSDPDNEILVLNETSELLFPMVNRIFSSYKLHAEAENKQFELKYIGDEQLCVYLDRQKLEAVMDNLISNALQNSSSGSVVEIGLVDKTNSIEIYVKANSNTFDEDEFNLINSVENSPRNSENQNLALEYSFDLIKLMNGKLNVESIKDEETIFTIILPRKEVLGAHRISEITTKTERIFIDKVDEKKLVSFNYKQTVLIVEDNHSLREYLRDLLAEKYNIIEAEHGGEALNKLIGENGMVTADIIVSDIIMPVMDGFQLLDQLKANSLLRNIPIIMATSRAEISDSLKALRIGVDDYLTKPYNEEELLVRLDNLLNNYSERKKYLKETVEIESKKIPEISGDEQTWLKTCEDYILNNLDDELLSVAFLATYFNMSESTMNRQIKKLIGMGTGKYIQELRLDTAKKMLENHTLKSISQVAYKVGFKDSKSFSRAFKNRFGKVPTEIQEVC